MVPSSASIKTSTSLLTFDFSSSLALSLSLPFFHHIYIFFRACGKVFYNVLKLFLLIPLVFYTLSLSFSFSFFISLFLFLIARAIISTDSIKDKLNRSFLMRKSSQIYFNYTKNSIIFNFQFARI